MAARSYTVVRIDGEGRAATADTFPLVLALLAFGCTPRAEAPLLETVEIIDGQAVQRHSWFFEEKSADGKWSADQLRKWWRDEAWLASHPEHPLTFLRDAARLAPQVARELAKSVPLGIVRRGQKMVLIPVDATPEEEARLMEKLAA